MVTTAQALAAGLTRDQVRHLWRSGRWTRIARGCFVPVGTSTEGALGDGLGLTPAGMRRARIRAAVACLRRSRHGA
ncbi:type IV toxin-antitoxin system AbiEi family antitoxin domain-containing protein [Micromonospora olivasterospora]|uniref:type IV toxin-antitoxin system AbiEi family antitoxin domain-containing protein n=1 Tax=Micromonospora olivasterospora TaxID=1880 RepID=UPI001FE9C310|nr:type IV toxin-antitoxin system AbiEi family antitoxin domain-containing protein [Micromonospora olivasterospora]